MGDHSRVAVKSGNGLGKGFAAAAAILWFLYCHEPAIVLSTAPTFRQVRHVLWREVHRIYHRARYDLGGTLLDTRLELAEGRFALGLSADSGDEFQGFHSPNMLIVVDDGGGGGAHLRGHRGGDDLSQLPVAAYRKPDHCRRRLPPGLPRGPPPVPHHHYLGPGQPQRKGHVAGFPDLGLL